jgi:hypothetical protein
MVVLPLLVVATFREFAEETIKPALEEQAGQGLCRVRNAQPGKVARSL